MSDKDNGFLKRKAQLRGLGFTKDDIIKILSVFPGIGSGKVSSKSVKKEAKGGLITEMYPRGYGKSKKSKRRPTKIY
jgi:hypothetical protein